MVDFSTLPDDTVRALIRDLLGKMRGEKADLIGEVVKRWLKLALRDIEEQKELDTEAVMEVVASPTLWPVSLEDETEKTGVTFIGYAKNSVEAYKLYKLACDNAWMLDKWGKKEGKRRIRKLWVNLMRIEELEIMSKAKRKKP